MPKQTPAERYAKLVADCRDQLQQIAEMLENLPAPDDEFPITWGYCDTIAEVETSLRLDVICFRELGLISRKPEQA